LKDLKRGNFQEKLPLAGIPFSENVEIKEN